MDIIIVAFIQRLQAPSALLTDLSSINVNLQLLPPFIECTDSIDSQEWLVEPFTILQDRGPVMRLLVCKNFRMAELQDYFMAHQITSVLQHCFTTHHIKSMKHFALQHTTSIMLYYIALRHTKSLCFIALLHDTPHY